MKRGIVVNVNNTIKKAYVIFPDLDNVKTYLLNNISTADLKINDVVACDFFNNNYSDGVVFGILNPTNVIYRFGNIPEGNYSEFAEDGSLKFVGNATVYKDLVFPLVQKNTGVGNPNFNTFIGNLVKPQFAVNDAIQLEASEFIHEWLEASTIEIHLHWTNMSNVNTDRYAKWEIEISYVTKSDGTAQWINPIVASIETKIPANTPALTEFYSSVTTIVPTGGKIGGQILMRLKRIASTGTAPETNPFATQVGAHIKCDMLGSRTTAGK